MGPPRPVATGLNNPRHLIVENGKVWVAEAGVGGDLQCIISPEGEQCLGRTGAITTIDRTGRVRRVVEGLPSLATPFDGSYGTGTADISLTGGKLNVLMSASGIDPVTGANPFGSNGPEMGRLLRHDPHARRLPDQRTSAVGRYTAFRRPSRSVRTVRCT